MVKLYKRSSTLKNILLFQILSYFYLHLVNSIHLGSSVLVFNVFTDFFMSKSYLIYIGATVFILTIFAHKLSKFFYLIFSLSFIFEASQIFLINLDKVILTLVFTHLVISFYFYLFLKMELEESIYGPSFHSLDVGDLDFHKIEVSLDGIFGKNFKGYLTNWDPVSCFVNLPKETANFRGPVGVNISYKGNLFFQRGEIVTSYSSGVGVKFKQDRRSRKNTSHDWNDFYAIIHDMGFKPRNT